MDRTHRRSADRSGMPDTGPAPAAGSAFSPAVSRWCFECTREHEGEVRARRSSIDPASLVPPDSALARDAEVAAQDLLTHFSTIPVVRTRGARPSPHCTGSRSTVSSCTWLRCSTTPVSRARCPTSTSRFAAPRWRASSPTATRSLLITGSSSRTRSPCTTPPASASSPVLRRTSSPPAHPSMSSGMRSARASSASTRGWASSGSSPGFSEPRPSKSLAAAPGICTASTRAT